MSDFNFKVKVDRTSTRLDLRFDDELPQTLRNRLAATMKTLTDELLAQVKAGEPRRTGRLASMTRSFVDVREDWVRGRVRVLGKAAAAAGALEYGTHRSFTVRAHRMRLSHVFGRPTHGSVMVSTYRRRANLPALRFLRDPAARMLPRARLALEAAVNDAISDTVKDTVK